jgi:KDO2-lipid IV(A) lauroyltransferase
VVTLFPDQVPDSSAGRVLVPFFDKPAWTGTLVSRLAQRPNVKVIFGYARRLPEGRGFEIYLTSAPEEIYASDLERSARALNQGIEACIERDPHQYLWQYKRFKGAVSSQLYKKKAG